MPERRERAVTSPKRGFIVHGRQADPHSQCTCFLTSAPMSVEHAYTYLRAPDDALISDPIRVRSGETVAERRRNWPEALQCTFSKLFFLF